MLESIVIMGIVMGIVELMKKYVALPKEAIFVPVLTLSAGLNALNAYLFGGAVDIMPYVAEGLEMGAIASGIYGLGKAALGKS